MDNLFNTDVNPNGEVPNYLLAADNHNIGNTLGGSWFDSDTWTTKFSNAGKFIATSVLSGADSLYNSAATVGSWAGISEEGAHDTGEWIASLDDDLGKYYQQNREAVDLAGFIVTSFVPGLAGIKLLNVGQNALRAGMATGAIGGNLARATGLLVPETQLYVRLAASEISAASGAVSTLNANTIRALGSGVYANVLEATAFEVAVQATMFKSPILDQQDGWDIAKNIALGAAVGGAIGGAIDGARSVYGIKKLVQGEVQAGKPFSNRFIGAEATPADQKIILTAEARDYRAIPVKLEGDGYALGSSNADANNKLYANAVEKDNNTIRASINSLVTGGDGTIGNMVADALYNAPAPQMMETMLHAADISTIGGISKIEQLRQKALKALDIDQVRSLETRYVKLTGEGSGTVSDVAPLITNIADTVSTSAGRTVRDAVLAEVRNYKFNTKELWDAAALSGKTSHTAAEARYIWANHVLPEVKAGTIIHANDIPLLERVIADLDKGKAVDYKIKYTDDSIGDGLTSTELRKHLAETKVATANKLLEDMVFRGSIPVEFGTEAISKIVNVRRGYLEGTHAEESFDLYARQAANVSHAKNLVSKGLRTEADEIIDTAFVPQYAKIGYKTKALEDIDGNVVDGMVWIKQQQKLFQESADRVFAKNAGADINSAALPVTDSVLLNANLTDGGAGLVSFANGSYGSLGSYMQQVGANVTRPLKEAYRKATAAAFEGPLVAMGSKREAAIEFDIINNRIAATTEQYVVDTAGYSGVQNALISKKIRDYHRAIEEGAENVPVPTLQKGAQEFIEVKNQETFDTIRAHIDREGSRVATRKEINSALGKEDFKEVDIFRPLRPNPDDYPFFAFVKDQKITGAGHTSMIHANTEAELRALVDKVPTDKGYKVIYKDQAEEYYKARGEFEYSRTLHENYIDSELKSKGINSQFFTKTDPQKIVDDILRYHTRADDVTAVELVRMKYQPAFDWLEDQGKQFSSVESSRYGNALSNVEKFGKNPYTDYTKTALDVSKASEYTLLYSANKELDRAVSVVYGSVAKMFAGAKSPADLAGINNILESHGINSAYNSAAADALINHTAPKAVLSKFIRSSNAILAKFTLMLDPLNGINNAVGANILRFTELKNIDRAIANGNTDVAGALAKQQRIGIPGVPEESVQSSTKLVSNAIRNFFNDTDGALLAQYQKEGLVKDTLNQFRDMLDDFTLRGTESVSDIDRRIASGFNRAKQLTDNALVAGEKYTGNKFFEQFNRFISADVMRQKTDAAEALGLLTPAESKAYRNTFVNRVEGNTIASQRPVMFQGPIGQAVGLFQSYQFNLMQQLFRYVGEGTGKDAAMLLGLQGTMYGLNGLPAFNAINTHIVGNLSGNKNHTDLYDATYGIAGKTAGDFLMYGIPSNIIQTNLYSRGDINPRTLTIIPNQIENIPIVSAYSKLFGSLYETAGKINGGGNVWESILQGVEHNGISRPLAGLAQTLQATTGNGVVFSTSNKGSIIGSNDFLSFATLSRLAGGRPLDEAIVNDGMYRIASYEAARKKSRDKLLETIKTTGIQGQEVDMESLDKFSEAYAATGGKQAQFNKFMLGAYQSSNTAQSEKILQQLQNPFNQKMQVLMGGRNEVTSGIGNTQNQEESQQMDVQSQEGE
jgi:hypothetical protein